MNARTYIEQCLMSAANIAKLNIEVTRAIDECNGKKIVKIITTEYTTYFVSRSTSFSPHFDHICGNWWTFFWSYTYYTQTHQTAINYSLFFSLYLSYSWFNALCKQHSIKLAFSFHCACKRTHTFSIRTYTTQFTIPCMEWECE